ncbi:helix-turn-helix domain-containing protein [Saccharopolyspora sp. NPDC000995]
MPRPDGPGDSEKIRKEIAMSGLTDRDIAQRMGCVSIQSVNAYRHGQRKPAAGRLVRLARALRIDVHELMREGD